MLRIILERKNMSMYSLEKKTDISHSTISDIYNEKINIDHCSVINIKKIAHALEMSMESLYDLLSYNDLKYVIFIRDFDLFKSEICHDYKRLSDKNFLKKYLVNNEIENLILEKEYEKAFYLLAFIDYLCIKNGVPLANKYNLLRNKKLNKLIVPESIYLLLANRKVKISSIIKEANKEFLKYNIIESEVENVI